MKVNKISRAIVIIAVCVITMALCACTISVTTANLQNVQTASQVDSSNKPVNVTSSFTTTAPYIYVTGVAANAPEGTKIRADWIYTETDPDTSIDSVTLSTTEISTSFKFSLSKPTNNWPKGKYEVKLYIDDKYVQSAAFEVK